MKRLKLLVGMISNLLQVPNTHNHLPNNPSSNPVKGNGKRMHQLMEVISGPLKVGIGLIMKIKHIHTRKITVMMVTDEVDTEDEGVAVDLEEEVSEAVVVVEITRMETEAVTMEVVAAVDIEAGVVVTLTVAVGMDTEVKEVADVVVSEVKMHLVEEDFEADVVVTEVTVVMVDITEGREVACTNNINIRCEL